MNRPVRYRIQPPPSSFGYFGDTPGGAGQQETALQVGPTQAQSDSASIAHRNFWIGYYILSTASSAACAFHGYRRNQSIGWALWWGLMGGLFPIFTPVIAVAEGFGKPIKK